MEAVFAAEKQPVSDGNAGDVGWSSGYELYSSRRIVFSIRRTGELPGGAVGQLLFHPTSRVRSAALSVCAPCRKSFSCALQTRLVHVPTPRAVPGLPTFKAALRWVAKPLKRPVDYGGELSLCHFPFFLLHYNDKIVLEAEQLINAESYS